jgi:hypothetical protein
MPTVPTLNPARTPQYREVDRQPAPGVRVNPDVSTHTPAKVIDTFNIEQQAKLGQTGMALGQELARIQIAEQNQINQTRVNDALNKAVETRLKLTYDRTDGYTALQGEAALNRPDGKPLDEEYAGRFQQQVDTLAQGLGNETQRREFLQQATQMGLQLRAGIQQYVAREQNAYDLSVQDGTVKTAQQQMGLSWGDPEAVSQAKNAIAAAVYQTGKLRGWSGQQTRAVMVEQLSQGHNAALSGAIDAGQLDYAREYLKQNNDELTPDVRLRAQKALDIGGFEAKTQGAAETLYSASKGDVGAALAEARKNYSGKEEDAIVQRIKGFDAERVALRERAQADAADNAWRVYASTGSINRIPPTTLAAMDGKALEALRRTARADAEAAAAKREVKTDPNVYYALSAAATGDPNFKSQDLRPFFDRLSPADRKHFIDLQTAAAKPERAAEVVSVGDQKAAMVKALGLKEEQAGVFHQVADKALFAAQQDKGRKLDQDERQKVLDKLVLQGEVLSGSWWRRDPNMRLFEAVASGQAAQFKAEFSDADRRKATEALQRRGVKNPSAQQIEATLQAAYGVR